MLITTRFGRSIETPSIRLSTNRKCVKDSKVCDVWLLEETKKEYQTRSDYVMVILNGMNPLRLTASDKDTLNDLLLPDGASEYIYELIESDK